MTNLLKDAKHAWRVLRRRPLVALAAVGSMALGVGANAATFSAVYSAIYKPLPFESADRLAYIARSTGVADGPERLHWSYPKFLELAENNPGAFAPLVAQGDRTVLLGLPGGATTAHAQFVTPEYFRLFGFSPHMGRFFDQPGGGGAQGVVISEGFWRSRLAAQAGIVGAPIDVNGTPFVVLGVTPPGFGGLDGQAQLWLPIASAPIVLREEGALSDRYWAYTIVGLIEPGSSFRVANVELGVIGQRLGSRATRLEAVSVRESKIPADLRRGLVVLLGAVALVMCAACLNVGILLLTMFESRRREFALRMALGAGAWRLAQQIAVELGLVTLAGAVAGLATAAFTSQLLWAARPVTESGWYRARGVRASVDGREYRGLLP